MVQILVTENFPPKVGGSAVLFENVYSRLSGLGVVVLTDPPEGDRTARPGLIVLPAAVGAPRWGVLDPAGLAHHLRLALDLRRLARPARDLVHCARAIPEGVAAFFSRVSGGPRYLCWAHGEDVSTALDSREFGLLLRAVYSGAAGILANSRNTARLVRELGVPPWRIHVVHPGVDAERFRVDPSRLARRTNGDGCRLALLTVGRLQRRKGHDQAIRAVSLLARDLPGLEYVVVGDGPERRRLEEIAREEGVSRRVRFVGQVSDEELPRWYASCDVFLHPNRADGRDIEGFGIVFLEAAAAGKPAIGGASGGVPEAIEHGVTGLLVDGDSPDAIASAIRKLAASEESRQRMGDAARARALVSFTWERAGKRVHEIVRALASRRPRTVRAERPIRVVQAVLSLEPGGTERLVIELARRLSPGVETCVSCLDRRGAWATQLDDAGIPVVVLGRRPGFQPSLALGLAGVAMAHGAQVLHCHQYTPFVYGALAAAAVRGPRVVYTEHGRLDDRPCGLRRRIATRFLSRLPGSFFAVSRHLADRLVAEESFPARKVSVIHNGIDPGEAPRLEDRWEARHSLGVDPRRFLVGTVARLDPVKDLGTLVEAFALFARARPDATLVLVGEGRERERLREAAAAAGVEGRTLFAGERFDVRRILPAFDLYANTSVSEGISLTILEAMAAGLPVVASAVGGTPEVVEEAKTGFLVSARSPVGFADAFDRVAADPARAWALGLAGRARVERSFSIDRMVRDYLEVYEREVRNRSRRVSRQTKFRQNDRSEVGNLANAAFEKERL